MKCFPNMKLKSTPRNQFEIQFGSQKVTYDKRYALRHKGLVLFRPAEHNFETMKKNLFSQSWKSF